MRAYILLYCTHVLGCFFYLRPAHEFGQVDCIKRRGVGRSEGVQVRVRVRGSDGVKVRFIEGLGLGWAFRRVRVKVAG